MVLNSLFVVSIHMRLVHMLHLVVILLVVDPVCIAHPERHQDVLLEVFCNHQLPLVMVIPKVQCMSQQHLQLCLQPGYRLQQHLLFRQVVMEKLLSTVVVDVVLFNNHQAMEVLRMDLGSTEQQPDVR